MFCSWLIRISAFLADIINRVFIEFRKLISAAESFLACFNFLNSSSKQIIYFWIFCFDISGTQAGCLAIIRHSAVSHAAILKL